MEKLKRALLTIVLAVCVALSTLSWAPTSAIAKPKQKTNPNQTFRITSIDVGKGDCTLCETGQYKVLIDAGYDYTSADVLSYLSDHGVRKLDALIISHYDKDHVGGAADVLQNVPVDKVYLPTYTGTSKKYQKMVDALQEKQVPCELVDEQTDLHFGGARYSLLPSDIAFDGDNDNDCSLSTTVRFHQYSAFFAGDLEEPGIDSFVTRYHKLKSCEIIKMPHHGKRFDNIDSMLDLVDPEIALVTDGHARRAQVTLLNNLKDRGIDTYGSAENGTTVITGLKGGGYGVEYEHDGNVGTIDQSGQWKYQLNDEGAALVAGYEGTASELVIPSELDGHPVVCIAPSAFYNNLTIAHVTVPAGVTEIGASAFSWCPELASIEIPDTVTLIDGFAFAHDGKLSQISFTGTGEQWDAIEKVEDWDKKTADAMVVDVVRMAA